MNPEYAAPFKVDQSNSTVLARQRSTAFSGSSLAKFPPADGNDTGGCAIRRSRGATRMMLMQKLASPYLRYEVTRQELDRFMVSK